MVMQKNQSISTLSTMQSDQQLLKEGGGKTSILEIKIDHPILIGGTLRMTQTK